jgi:hypothetical protein
VKDKAIEVKDNVVGTVREVPHVIASGASAEFLGNEIVAATKTVTLGQSNRILGINGDCLGLAGDVGSVLGIPIAAGGAVRGVGEAGKVFSNTRLGRYIQVLAPTCVDPTSDRARPLTWRARASRARGGPPPPSPPAAAPPART